MAKVVVNVSPDAFFDALYAPGIVGPSPNTDCSGWVVYIPGQPPCICDSFHDAAEMMAERMHKQARGGPAVRKGEGWTARTGSGPVPQDGSPE